MVQTLQLNIIPFTAPIQEAEFANDLEGLLTDKFTPLELLELEKLHTDFQPPKEGALVIWDIKRKSKWQGYFRCMEIEGRKMVFFT